MQPGPTMDDFDYDLPEAAIAQVPVEPRHDARLLVDAGPGAPPLHRHVRDLPSLVGPGDLVVVNDTRVLPGRLRLRRATGGAVEVLLLEPVPVATGDGAPGDPVTWEALVRPSRRLPPGERLTSAHPAGGDLEVELGEHLGEGRRVVHLRASEDVLDAVHAHGSVPLPPYIRVPLADPDRYQTVYAARPASAAAPTAGLHLTEEVLDGCRAAGAELATVELVVGVDTFRKVTAERPAEHVMHSERFRVPPATWEAVRAARRVVAVGTTTLRALESAALGTLEGRTRLFVQRPFAFGAVDVLLTNFHQPRTTLLVLLDAFVGPRWRELYGTALDAGYRFLSFGDAMLVARDPAWGPD